MAQERYIQGTYWVKENQITAWREENCLSKDSKKLDEAQCWRTSSVNRKYNLTPEKPILCQASPEIQNQV